jgi:hypothetical protein
MQIGFLHRLDIRHLTAMACGPCGSCERPQPSSPNLSPGATLSAKGVVPAAASQAGQDDDGRFDGR